MGDHHHLDIRQYGGGANGEKWRKMAKNGEKWRWRIRLFHLSNSPFFANFWFWNFTFNRLSHSQSSWNFAQSLLASIPNKRDPYWMNPSMFWKWLILALWEVGSRDRSKIRLSLIFSKFAGNLDIDSLNRSETSETENITFWPKYATWHVVPSDAWIHGVPTKSEDHAPIYPLPGGQSSWNFVGSLLASKDIR